MTISLKYISHELKSGRIYRPLIPLTFYGRENRDVIGILDSGSDISIIPKEIVEFLEIELFDNNEVFGISGTSIKVKEGKMRITFGKGREFYNFEIPILVPDSDDVPLIIGRKGFFDQFKITFIESEKKILFKKYPKEKP
ncbi:MAG: retropepsin-like aspartic protease [Nanoarchaeota archaeon]